MPTIMEQIKEFHRVFQITDDQREIRKVLIEEEHREAQETLTILEDLEIGPLADSPNKEVLTEAARQELAKELADLVYTAGGTAKVYGIDLDRAIVEVHKSNMSKLDDEGKPIFNEEGKVLKSGNYREPDMSVALEDK